MTRPIKPLPALQRLREVLRYDRDTGVFTWIDAAKVRSAGREQAGGLLKCGHIQIVIDCVPYKAHRLAWLWVTGQEPVHEIDHRNGRHADNRFSNLRDVRHRKNMENRRCANAGNPVGLLGVSKGKRARFRAQIKVAGKQVWLGAFDDPELAHQAYVQAKRRLHEGNTL